MDLLSNHNSIEESQLLKATSVACAVGPGVSTLRAQLIFPSKLDFCNLFEFPATKSTKKSISSTP
jgi:hypothetical protein